MNAPTDPAPFQLFAWYNERVNDALHTTLAALAGDTADLPLRSGTTFVGSILDVLAHIVYADIAWIRRLWPERASDPELTLPAESGFENPYANVAAWWEARKRTDAYMIELVSSIAAR